MQQQLRKFFVFHKRFKVFFLSFKLFSFFAWAFLSTAEVTLQDFFANVSEVASDDVVAVAPSLDVDDELAFESSLTTCFGLAWISVYILALNLLICVYVHSLFSCGQVSIGSITIFRCSEDLNIQMIQIYPLPDGRLFKWSQSRNLSCSLDCSIYSYKLCFDIRQSRLNDWLNDKR